MKDYQKMFDRLLIITVLLWLTIIAWAFMGGCTLIHVGGDSENLTLDRPINRHIEIESDIETEKLIKKHDKKTKSQ